ncbi:MAG: hypothetical protein Q9219_000321 [cf. Caloplaca sp. 3 TL-2023]
MSVPGSCGSLVNRSQMLIFAFEFTVLAILSLSTTARYALSLYENGVIEHQISRERANLRQRTEDPLSEEEINSREIDTAGWEEKDFFKLVLYLTFFCVLCMFYGMPIHIIRDVALTIRSFYKRIRDFVQYKHATKDMNARYPDATADEISREDVCIICRETMTAWQGSTNHLGSEATPAERHSTDERQRAKKLPCGHLLHFACLRSWLERQQICPTCRTPVLSNPPEPPNPTRAAGLAAHGGPRIANPPARAPHIYTFGPFRLIFGARGANNDPHANPLAVGAVGNPTDAMLNRSPVRVHFASVQAQLNQIEQLIIREINNLNSASDQLQIVRALQFELGRLRYAQGTADNQVSQSYYQSREALQVPPQQAMHAYRQLPLSQGMREFPVGLSIPENWSLHALQRIEGNLRVGMQTGNGAEGPLREAQPTATYSHDAHAIHDLSRSNGSAYDLGTGNHTTSAAPTISNLARDIPSDLIEPTQTPDDGQSSGLPEWDLPKVPGGENDEHPVDETCRTQSPKRKGKGKAAMVEDDTDHLEG